MELTARARPVPGPAWPRRAALAAFALLVAVTQLLWLTFAPVTDEAARALGVSAGAVGDLAAVQPLLYVLLALPAGRWTDRSFATALSAGAVLTAGGAVLRAVDPGSYGPVLAGQLAIAVGQPLVLNATTKVAARWFAPAERTVAISVASAAQFVGILGAALTAAPLVAAGGLRLLLGVQAVVAVVAGVAVLVAVRLPEAFPSGDAGPGSLAWLRGNRTVWLLAGLLLVGVGTFNALATWLDTLLAGLDVDADSGLLIAATTVAGIAGAATLPALAARHDRRRALLLTTTATTVVVLPALVLAARTPWAVPAVATLLVVEGFLLLACLPVALDWSELEAGPQRAATATGLLLLAGNLGGTVLVLLVQALAGDARLALLAMGAAALPGVALARGLPRRTTPDDDDAAVGPPADPLERRRDAGRRADTLGG